MGGTLQGIVTGIWCECSGCIQRLRAIRDLVRNLASVGDWSGIWRVFTSSLWGIP